MKKLKFALLFILLSQLSYAQLVNDGATITIKSGATLFVESDVQNNSTGTITVENGGTLEIQGDFVNAGTATYTATGTGKMKFSGSANSELSSGGDAIPNLEIAKTNAKVTLLQAATVGTNLDFGTGTTKLELGTNNLTLGNATTVTDATSTAYIIADAAGMVQKDVTANNTFTFPVGDANNYSPLASTYTGSAYASANLRVNVVDAVHPSKPTDAESFLTRYWNVDQTGISDYSNTVTGTYVSDDVNGTASLIKGASHDGANWSYAGAATNGTSTVTGTLSAMNSDFTGTNFYGKVDFKVLLAGNYNTGTNLMSTTLNSGGILEASALTTPYAVSPFNAPSVSVSPGFFAANPTIVDWVMLELRETSAPSTTSTNKASAFLKSDGSIVGIDGTSLPVIKNGSPTSVVVVHHRNHLAFRTKNVGIDVANPSPIDFRSDTTKVFKGSFTNTPIKLVENAPNGPNNLEAWAMWTGDVNKDGKIRYLPQPVPPIASDASLILTSTTANGGLNGVTSGTFSGYSFYDVNLDGKVRYLPQPVPPLPSDAGLILTSSLLGVTSATVSQHN
jgi:hypothetical protein